MENSRPDFSLCISRTLIWQLLALAGVVLLFAYAGHVVLTAFAGVLLAIILRGLATYIERFSFISPRWSYMTVLGAIVVIVAVLGYLLGPRVFKEGHELTKALPASLDRFRADLERTATGRDIVRIVSEALEKQQHGTSAFTYASAAADAVTQGIVMIAIALFLAADPRFYLGGLRKLLPQQHRDRITRVLGNVGTVVQRWLLGQLVPMVALGVGSFIGLSILGIPLAFALSLFTALMLFIPYAGSVMAYIPTALIALAKGPAAVVEVTILYLGVHTLEGYVITPLAQRHAVRLPPALTLFSQFLMWQLAGVLGVIIAAPLTAVCLATAADLRTGRADLKG
jgi:predicted PurR-regulated permease PerM